MQSIFTAKDIKPTNALLKKALGKTFPFWNDLYTYTISVVAGAKEEWSYSKYGWSFRISDKKRVVLYLLPRDGFFKAAMVFGARATGAVMDSSVADSIKTELQKAKPYAEGRGIRIDITDATLVHDMKALIDIKIL